MHQIPPAENEQCQLWERGDTSQATHPALNMGIVDGIPAEVAKLPVLIVNDCTVEVEHFRRALVEHGRALAVLLPRVRVLRPVWCETVEIRNAH